jgi:hypothetical protein
VRHAELGRREPEQTGNTVFSFLDENLLQIRHIAADIYT